MLSPDVLRYIETSVLCWLATVDAEGWPNVSPKEVFAALDDTHLAIADIASPGSVKNIRANPQVCVSFVDVFAQRGFKVQGTARVVEPTEAEFADLIKPLEQITQGVFPIHRVICVEVNRVSPILAPSYHLISGTTEETQRQSAMKTYGVRPID